MNSDKKNDMKIFNEKNKMTLEPMLAKIIIHNKFENSFNDHFFDKNYIGNILIDIINDIKCLTYKFINKITILYNSILDDKCDKICRFIYDKYKKTIEIYLIKLLNIFKQYEKYCNFNFNKIDSTEYELKLIKYTEYNNICLNNKSIEYYFSFASFNIYYNFKNKQIDFFFKPKNCSVKYFKFIITPYLHININKVNKNDIMNVLCDITHYN